MLARQRWWPALGADRPGPSKWISRRGPAGRGSVRAGRAAPTQPGSAGPGGPPEVLPAPPQRGRPGRRRERCRSARGGTRRVQPVQVPGRRAAQPFGAAGRPGAASPARCPPARPAAARYGGDRAPQPLGQRGGDDLDPVPAAGDTPGRQQHMGAPAVGATGAPRGQPHPSAVEQRHHPGRAYDHGASRPAAQDGHASRRAARSASARSGSRYSSTPAQLSGSCPARWSRSSGRGRGSSCCTLAEE